MQTIKVKSKLVIVLFILIISGCLGTKISSNNTQLPELTIENERLDHLIVDRKPDYGYGGTDGCIVMREISMEISELNQGSNLYGNVFDARDKTPLANAALLFNINNSGSVETIETLSDENGFFDIEFNGEVEEIFVAYISYRTLKVDFR